MSLQRWQMAIVSVPRRVNNQPNFERRPLELRMKLLAASLFVLAGSGAAFTVGPAAVSVRQLPRSSSSRLFIEKWVADMIDQELFREQHKADYERAWMEKNRAAVLKGFQSSDSNLLVTEAGADDALDARQKVKDTKLARENPQQYCADRCVATGHCDVYEDLYVGKRNARSFGELNR
jgi:hypothetical protein